MSSINMKRLAMVLAGVIFVSAVVAFLFCRDDEKCSDKSRTTGLQSPAAVAPIPRQQSVAIPQVSGSRPPPPGSEGGMDPFIVLLVEGIALAPSQEANLARFLASYRAKIYSRFGELAKIERIADHTHMASVDVPKDEAESLRKECYEGIADAIGVENLQRMISLGKASILDGDFEDFGTVPFTVSATLDRESRPFQLVEFRTDRKRTIGSEPVDAYRGGTLLVGDFEKRYGALGTRLLDSLSPP